MEARTAPQPMGIPTAKSTAVAMTARRLRNSFGRFAVEQSCQVRLRSRRRRVEVVSAVAEQCSRRVGNIADTFELVISRLEDRLSLFRAIPFIENKDPSCCGFLQVDKPGGPQTL